MYVPKSFAEVKKGVTAACGALAEVVALGFLSGTAENVAVAVLALATALGVYTVQNADAPVVDTPLA